MVLERRYDGYILASISQCVIYVGMTVADLEVITRIGDRETPGLITLVFLTARPIVFAWGGVLADK